MCKLFNSLRHFELIRCLFRWSFGIFLWTLFLKCNKQQSIFIFIFELIFCLGRMRPFEQLSNEVRNNPNGGSFFNCLADVVSKGQVLEYIDFQQEIPTNMYDSTRKHKEYFR